MKLFATVIAAALVSTAVMAKQHKAAPAADKGICTVLNADGTKTQSETTKAACEASKGTFEVASATKTEHKK